METIRKIIESFGGMDALWDSKAIRINCDPFRWLLVELAERSPNGLTAISVRQQSRENGLTRTEIHVAFEICDLGWLPYYYKNVFDVFEGVVYKQDSEGRILTVRHTMRQKLIQIARDWDALLEDREYTTLSGIHDVASFFPPPFFISRHPVL